jgi:hypothetical protein
MSAPHAAAGQPDRAGDEAGKREDMRGSGRRGGQGHQARGPSDHTGEARSRAPAARKMLRAMERDLGRPLTEQEEHLSLEQARSLGLV